MGGMGCQQCHESPCECPETAAFFALEEDLEKLGLDELRVAHWVVKRLLVGKQKYGGLKLSEDNRGHSDKGWEHEAREELLDFAVYMGCRAVQALDKEKGKDDGK